MGPLLDEVYRFVRGHEELATGDGTERWQNVMLYKDDRPDVEVGVLAARSFEPEGRVISSLLPGGEAATAIHRGDYAGLGASHDAVRADVAACGRDLAGPRWEIYGHWREDGSGSRPRSSGCSADPCRAQESAARSSSVRTRWTFTGSRPTSTECPDAATAPFGSRTS